MKFAFIAEQLAQQQQLARYRQRQCVTEVNCQNITVGGKHYLNFSSNDYLGLNQHPNILKALQQGIDRYGVCSTGSNLITGYVGVHQALEEKICSWLNKPRCLLFTSGFSANCGFLQAIAKPDMQIWLDKLSHASLIDGALNSPAKVRRFLHNNVEQLARYLADHQDKDQVVVSEGVFSMDGDQAPVAELAKLSQQHQALLYLDEAHSLGVIGKTGQGCTANLKGNEHVDVVMATFGKAVATSGAFIACDNNMAEYLSNFSRHYIYTTAMSPAMAQATSASIELIQKEHWRREKIEQLSELFISKLDCDLDVLPTASSIHALVIGDEEKTLSVSQQLKKQGYWLSAIRPPTVAKNTSRLRVTICANHNANDISELAETINKVMN